MQRLLDHVGLLRPFRFERAVPVLLALLSAVVVALIAARFVASGVLPLDSPRGAYFAYLFALIALVIVLARWPRLAVTVLVLMLIELTWGFGTYALNRVGISTVLLLPPDKVEPQRFQWHPLLQAVPIPSLKLTSSTGLGSATPREGTRGKDPEPGELDGSAASWPLSAARRPTISAPAKARPGPTAWRPRWAGSLLRRQSRRAGLHHGRAPDPDGVLPDQVRQAAALRDLLCRLERPAQRAHPQPRSRPMPISICRARSIRLKVRRGRRHARHVLAVAHAADAPRQRRSSTPFVTSRIPTASQPKSGDDPGARCAATSATSRSISAINRQRGVTTIWVGQLLNRDR